MKSKIILCLFFNAFFFTSKGQVFLVNLTDSTFIYNEKSLNAKDKVCYVFNCLIRRNIDYAANSFRPLIVFKVFDFVGTKKNISQPIRFTLLKDYLKKTIVPKLNADVLLKANNFRMTNSDPNVHVIDSLIVYDGKSYSLIEGGIVILEFFNVYPYKQLNPLQTNQSALNIDADTVQIHSWVGDNLPIPNIDDLINGRIFLLKKDKNDYTFFRHPFDCLDCPLTFYNEYVYRKDYGIIAFKSKYLQPYKDVEFKSLFGKIIESTQYYYFK